MLHTALFGVGMGLVPSTGMLHTTLYDVGMGLVRSTGMLHTTLFRICMGLKLMTYIYTQSQKLSNFLQQCTDVQASRICFHNPLQVEGVFTGLPQFNTQSVSRVLYTARRTREKRARRVSKLPVFASITYD